MTLPVGTRLGPYEILAPLGAGGMGEVYRARDPRLAREVAVKVLPDAVSEDPERLARFAREAKVLASLNHPHIAAICGLEESGPIRALVLELVEGETLAERIASGPIPVGEALPIARQIAEALEAAHEKGIVHRDLKPANVKLTPEGKVKVLDFGLAKALTGDASSPDVTSSPTLTAAATQAGVVIGTAAYMSPEQARGKSVDKRGDVWAFGAVLYEMLSGKKAFEGETVSDTLAAVLTKDPNWSVLPSGTPPSVRRVLKRCLDRDARTRLHDIADARLEMDEAPEPFAAGPTLAQPAWRRAIPWALSAIFALAAVAALLRPVAREAAPAPPVVRVSKSLDNVAEIEGTLAISPDGARVVIPAWESTVGGRFVMWRIEESETRPIAGTTSAIWGQPFFSPDGNWLGLVGDGKVRKAALSGGGFIDVAKAPFEKSVGACWTQGGQIVLGRRSGGLMAVPAAGGELRDLTKADAPELSHRWPQALPGDRALLFTIDRGQKGRSAAIVPLSRGRADGAIRELLSDADVAQFVAPGYLVFRRGNRVFVVPFDLASLTVTGPAVPVLGGAGPASYEDSAGLAVSATGTLVYAPRRKGSGLRRLVWVDRAGREAPLDLPSRDYYDPGISPDGDRISFLIQEEKPEHLWVRTLKTGASTRLTFEEVLNMAPVWTPDGRRIVHVAGGPGPIVSRSADGSGPPVKLWADDVDAFPTSWSSDGRTLAMETSSATTGLDVTVLRCEEPGGVQGRCRLEELIATEHDEDNPYFSPDGRYLAYVSNESGGNEVYVQAFPGPGGKWQLSTAGGREPRWSRDGKELFYRAGDALMAVSVVSSPTFSFGAPRRLFEAPYAYVGGIDNYDVGPDGRFLFMKNVEGGAKLSLELVLNWPTELARLAPTGAKK